jgi:hypothetical protein
MKLFEDNEWLLNDAHLIMKLQDFTSFIQNMPKATI